MKNLSRDEKLGKKAGQNERINKLERRTNNT
jgi:hypothetical protein